MTQTNLTKAFRHHIKSFKTRTAILFIFIYKTRQDRDYACETFRAYFSCIFLAWLGEMRGVLLYPNATAVSNPRLRSTYCTVHCIVCCLHVVHDRQLLVLKMNFNLPNDPRYVAKGLDGCWEYGLQQCTSFILLLMIAFPFTLSNFQTLYSFHMFSL